MASSTAKIINEVINQEFYIRSLIIFSPISLKPHLAIKRFRAINMRCFLFAHENNRS